MLSVILLTAGKSSRFSSPKALAKLKSKTIIEHLQETLLETSLQEIIIVTGYEHAKLLPFIFKHKRIKVVYNKDYNFGQTSSFKTGLSVADKDSSGFMILPVDYPCLKSGTIEYLIKTFSETQPLILIPTFGSKKGHPPIFNKSLRKELLAMNNNTGINSFSLGYIKDTKLTEVTDAGVIYTFNTQEEFEEIKRNIT